ncbi:chromate transporter [Actinotalea sp. K2]|uniref:chromate transporter n=1 Tax=Actinotalea sp. K2 TaxID=2939438 RepID=UPI0020179135|nr:chromate transporter [Actinotalea sp. K2]MCL3862143.1 chromate transporter [Actinotalea sp. K2]
MAKVGLIGFGGGSALIPLVNDELVGRRRSLEPGTFTCHTVVASITPGALPVKLGGLAGLRISGAWLSLAMAVVVALPGTLLTVGLVSAVAAGGASAIRYVEFASIGITVFIVALLVHYITTVITAEGSDRRVAVAVAVVAFLGTGAGEVVELAGHLVGQDWDVELATLAAVQLIGGALVVIVIRALVRRESPLYGSYPEPDAGSAHRRVVHAALLLIGVGVAAVGVAVAFTGTAALELLGLVLLSTLTSFGGGEAYVGVADGFFVAGGYVSSSVFYSQLVPIANALPGPILVKLASGVGYAAVAPDQGPAMGWMMAGAAALVAITSCTAVAVLIMGAYQRAQRSPVVRDIGLYILPVICGLLISTSAAMLNAAARVTEAADAPTPLVIWFSLIGIVVVTRLRHRRTVPDVLLLAACGAVSLTALLST